jgi:arylsulfatase A-like enzyme
MKATRKSVFIVLIPALLILAFSCGNPPEEEGRRPNLLFIMTDQQRFDALGYAGNSALETPNLDRLAKEGAWFKNAYTQCAVCTPARVSMLTGSALKNTGVISNGNAYDEEETGIMPMKTYDEVLAENGYTCEYYGKWHTPTFHGRIYKNPVTVAGKSKSELGPGKKTAYLDYLDPLYPERDLLPGELMDTYTDRPYMPHPIDLRYDLASRGEDADINPGQSDIHGVTTIPSAYHISAFEAEKTIKALERLKDSTFSITCSFHHPHPPFLAAEDYVEMYPADRMVTPESIDDDMENSPYLRVKKATSALYSDPEKIKYFISEYYALVKEVDDRIGDILDKLDELGLAENTLVVFVSDHGEMLGAHGMRSKNVFYEEASHVPMMIRFPGRIKPETKVDAYVSNINLFATILDYLEMPEHASDGFSLRGLIEGTERENGRYVVTEWLSNLDTKPAHMVIKDGWKLMIPDSSATKVIKALYDLNTDPLEMNNLLGSNPDASRYDAKVEELEACYREWNTATDRGVK